MFLDLSGQHADEDQKSYWMPLINQYRIMGAMLRLNWDMAQCACKDDWLEIGWLMSIVGLETTATLIKKKISSLFTVPR